MFILNSFYFLVFLCSVRGELIALRKKGPVLSPYVCPNIYVQLHVSNKMGKNNLYKFRVQWSNANLQEGDWIGIFQSDPQGKVLLEPIEVLHISLKSGSMKTELLEEKIKPENLGYRGKCLNYYAGYFDKCHNCLAATCLRIEPDWMWRLKPKIGRKRLKNVVIPGTFESGWFTDNYKNVTKNKKFITQREGVLGQLIYGTRYLHIRVSYQPHERHKFWATNNEHKLCPLHNIFNDIRTFLINTKEIIIVDFREFQKEFNDLKIHRSFIHFLDLNLGDLAVPNTLNWNSTFNKIWYSGRRLIICYNLRNLKSTYMWKSIVHKQSNADNVKKQHKFIQDLYQSPPQTPWAAITRISEDSTDASSLDESSSYITSWYRKKEWLQKSNIVSVDFLKNKGIVKSAIEWNSGECF